MSGITFPIKVVAPARWWDKSPYLYIARPANGRCHREMYKVVGAWLPNNNFVPPSNYSPSANQHYRPTFIPCGRWRIDTGRYYHPTLDNMTEFRYQQSGVRKPFVGAYIYWEQAAGGGPESLSLALFGKRFAGPFFSHKFDLPACGESETVAISDRGQDNIQVHAVLSANAASLGFFANTQIWFNEGWKSTAFCSPLVMQFRERVVYAPETDPTTIPAPPDSQR